MSHSAPNSGSRSGTNPPITETGKCVTAGRRDSGLGVGASGLGASCELSARGVSHQDLAVRAGFLPALAFGFFSPLATSHWSLLLGCVSAELGVRWGDRDVRPSIHDHKTKIHNPLRAGSDGWTPSIGEGGALSRCTSSGSATGLRPPKGPLGTVYDLDFGPQAGEGSLRNRCI